MNGKIKINDGVNIKEDYNGENILPWENNDRPGLSVRDSTDFGGITTIDKDGDSSTTDDADTLIYWGDNGNDRLRFGFYRRNGSEAVLEDKMTLLPNGNLGIGTTDPQAKLDVNGEIKARNGYGDIIGIGGDSRADDMEIFSYAPEERNKLVLYNRKLRKSMDLVVGNIKVNSKIYIWRKSGTIIYMRDVDGTTYSLDTNGLDDGKWHCSDNDKICYNSHGSDEDAELQFKIDESPSVYCTLLHGEDDRPGRSKGFYYSTDSGNNCKVYTNDAPCFNIQKEGATTLPIVERVGYSIICF